MEKVSACRAGRSCQHAALLSIWKEDNHVEQSNGLCSGAGGRCPALGVCSFPGRTTTGHETGLKHVLDHCR